MVLYFVKDLSSKVLPFHIVDGSIFDATGNLVTDVVSTLMKEHPDLTEEQIKCDLEDMKLVKKYPDVAKLDFINTFERTNWRAFEYCPERGLHYPHVTDPHEVMLSKVLYSDGTIEEANFDMTYYTGYGDPEANQFNPANGRHIIAWLEEVE